MKIEVRFRGLEASEALRHHVVRRLHFHLGRFGQAVTVASVRIGDVNGPRGGIDKRCQISVQGPALGSLRIVELSADPYAAVDAATERLGRSVARGLDRGRGPRQGGPSIRRTS